MKKYEYFNVNEINTLEELKKEFKRLAFKLHPDKGGGTLKNLKRSIMNMRNYLRYTKTSQQIQQKKMRI